MYRTVTFRFSSVGACARFVAACLDNAVPAKRTDSMTACVVRSRYASDISFAHELFAR